VTRFRRRLARFNQRYANRVVGRVLVHLPGFGLVHHRGRRSGRAYRTPVKVFRSGENYLISLPYGADSDWVRNVLAAGRCELTTGRRTVSLVAPRVLVDPAPAGLPPFVLAVHKRLDVTQHLILEPAPAADRARPRR
jgi:deazaflavin-dependent oxidoreductase (nitroreductase family)